MTDLTIQKQIDAIKRATAEALKSKESARKFLIDVGVIKEKNNIKSSSVKKK